MVLLFALGLLPYVDNFAHVFGFLYGFFLSLILLPYVTFGKWDQTRKRIQIVAAILFLAILTVTGFFLFYVKQEFSAPNLEYLNCVPVTSDFCSNFHKGQNLEPRQGLEHY